MKKISIVSMLALSLIISAQNIEKKCKTCKKPISQCRYKGKHSQSSKPVTASIVIDDGMKYEITGNQAALIKGKDSPVISVPQYIKHNGRNIQVTSIGSYSTFGGRVAFLGCKGLTSITIPNSVTSIGACAFEGCTNLISISIPRSVTKIYGSAFSRCSGLTSVTIPNSVTSIGESAFYGCVNLSSIVVESGNSKYDSRNNCNAIIETETNTLIKGCKNTIIPYGITIIEDRAFQDCEGLTRITIPRSVTNIGEYAFSGCTGLTSITIPLSVISIGNPNRKTGIGGLAFSGCNSLATIVVENGNPKYDSRNNCNAIIETETNTMIECCNNTTIPYGVERIGNGVFDGCTGLTGINIPNSVKSIGSLAFSGCTRLTSITIPQSVTSMSSDSFSRCVNLSSIIVENGNPRYDSRDNCNAIIETGTNTLIYGCKNSKIPNGVTCIGSYAFSNINLTSISIPNSVINICSDAFFSCKGITSIIIPKSVTKIGNNAFNFCISLTAMAVESGNTKYDSRNNCNAIIETGTNTLIYGCKNTTIPNSVTSIGSYAFYGCTDLSSITIPNGVTSIEGRSTFFRCNNLVYVSIPSSLLKKIDKEVFDTCYKLSSITVRYPNGIEKNMSIKDVCRD